MKPLLLSIGLVALALGATALPYLPGRHDSLAVPLSGVARMLGLGSVLLVPIGLVWLVLEWRQTGAGHVRSRKAFVFAALAAASIAVLAAAAFAAALSGATMAVCVLASWGFALRWAVPQLSTWARRSQGRDVTPALAVFLVPLVVAGGQLALARPLTSLAYAKTMDGMTLLIADIERYRVANDRYPKSLFSEWMDYRPRVIGVAGYLYEPTSDAFRLAVEVPTFSFDSREFLHYDPSGATVMASHDNDLLVRTAAEQPLYRGFHTARDLDRPHWKLLSFD